LLEGLERRWSFRFESWATQTASIELEATTRELDIKLEHFGPFLFGFRK
jgi:hypothetical protein